MAAERNPPWSRDELILALDLYMAHHPRLPPKDGPEVRELSEVLNRLHRSPGGDHRPGDKTRLQDLALLCANCHRMIHRARPWLSVEEVRASLLPVQST